MKDAFAATATHRGTTDQVADIIALLKLIEDSAELRLMWEKYRKEFDYAADIAYKQVIDALRNVSKELF